MSAEFFDYDPDTGVRYDIDEYDGLEICRRMQDVEPLIEKNKAIRNQGLADGGIKQGWWHVCDVPPVIILELKKQGYDLFTKDDNEFTKVLQKIQSDYPYLTTTNRKIA